MGLAGSVGWLVRGVSRCVISLFRLVLYVILILTAYFYGPTITGTDWLVVVLVGRWVWLVLLVGWFVESHAVSFHSFDWF